MKYLLFIIIVFVNLSLFSEELIEKKYKIDSESLLSLFGSATLKKWMCQNPDVEGEVSFSIRKTEFLAWIQYIENLHHEQMEYGLSIDCDVPNLLSLNGHITSEVINFDCENRMMEKDMFKALKEKEYPLIHYQINRVQSIKMKKIQTRKHYYLDTSGTLQVAGVDRDIEMVVEVEFMENGIRAIGMKSILMTDFNVTPPTALLGLIKAHNKVKFFFNLLLIEEKSA